MISAMARNASTTRRVQRRDPCSACQNGRAVQQEGRLADVPAKSERDISKWGITTPPAHEHLAWSVVTLVAAAVLGAVAALSAQDARSVWSRIPVDGEVIVTTRWPVPERCQAAATKTTLYVADRSGSLLWQWPFRQTNRFIHVTQHSTVALSADCQYAILAGNVDYKVRVDGGSRWSRARPSDYRYSAVRRIQSRWNDRGGGHRRTARILIGSNVDGQVEW